MLYIMLQIVGNDEVGEMDGIQENEFSALPSRPINVANRDLFNSVISLEAKVTSAITHFDTKVELLYKLKLQYVRPNCC